MSITRWLQFVRVRVCPLDGPKLKAWLCPSEWPRPDGPRLHTRLGISISFCRSLRDACHPSSTAQERFSLSAVARPDEHVHPPTAAGVTKPQTLDSGTPLDRKLACGVRHALDGTACKTQNLNKTPYDQKHLRRASPVFPPCVLAMSGVSTTPPRLWPAAPLTIPVKLKSAFQAPVQLAGLHNTCTNVLDEAAVPDKEACTQRCDIAIATLSTPKGVRGPFKLPDDYDQVHSDLPYTKNDQLKTSKERLNAGSTEDAYNMDRTSEPHKNQRLET